MSEAKPTPKIQAVRISFSNGKTADFIGVAVVPEEDMDKVHITNVELGHPEEFTDQIKESLIGSESDN